MWQFGDVRYPIGIKSTRQCSLHFDLQTHFLTKLLRACELTIYLIKIILLYQTIGIKNNTE